MRNTHLVVDGSNIATEGRTAPSLAQLDEAVRAFLEEYDVKVVTVVVDATFGHRIDASEVTAFEEGILNGELVTPPAGAIGRGDAFILGVADRADATVLSNDSFQEFHGQYPWLFEEGRLIGGKPVPNVGWVFVPRAPVRGPTSRRSIRDAKKTPAKATRSTKATKGPPTKKAAGAKPAKARAPVAAPVEPETAPVVDASDASDALDASSRRRRRGTGRVQEPLNEQRTYALFVIDHPIGSVVEGVVDRFSSHGAYIRVGEAQCYVPLRVLGDPPPRSAREVLNLGETRAFVVQRFDPARKGIDVVPADGQLAKTVAIAAEASKQTTDAQEAPVSPVAKKASARKAAKKAPARKAAKKAPAKRAPAKRAPAKKAPAKRAPAKKAPAKRAAAKKAPAKRTAARRAPAKKR